MFYQFHQQILIFLIHMGNKVLRPNQDAPLEGFNDDQLLYITDKFDVLQDEKGHLDSKLFCDTYKCSEEQAQKFFKFIDNEENGDITLYEFKCAAASLHQDDEQALRMIHEIYSTQQGVNEQNFIYLYKTIFLYLKDMNIIKEDYKDDIGKAKFKQYDYNKNQSLDFKQFSDMLKNDFHCKKWMSVLGFTEEDNFMVERIEKPENNADGDDEFAEDENEGDQAGAAPNWIQTAKYMAPSSLPPADHNVTPSNNLEIQYVYGYRSYDTRDNLKYNSKGQAVYHTAGVGIVLNQNKNTMKTMDIHNDDITCIDVRDNITVTGEMGRKPLIVVWDNQTMNSIATFSSPLENSIACIALSPSKRYVAASSMSDKHQIAIYDIEQKKLVATGNGPRSVIYTLKFNQTEDMVAASCAKEVVFAEFKGGKFKVTKGVFGKTPIVASFSLARYGNGFLSGMQNGSILLWKGTSCTKPYKEHNSAVTALCETEKGGVISGDVAGNILIWSNNMVVQKKIEVCKLIKDLNNPKVIALANRESNLLIGTRGGQIIETDLSKNNGVLIMQGHFDKQLWGVSSSTKSNHFFTGGQDKLLIKWDMKTRKRVSKIKIKYEIMSIDYNEKQNIVAVGMRNGVVEFYNADTFKLVGTISESFKKNPDKEMLSVVKYSPDCSLIAVGYCPPKSQVYIYETAKYKKVGETKNCVSRITSIDFTTDGESIMLNNTSYEILFFVARAKGNQITPSKMKTSKWNQDQWATMSCKFSWQAQGVWPHLYADGSNINAVERSHNGKLLASGDDYSKIKLFKYPACFQKQFFNVYKGHSSHITGIKWSYNDDYMISIGGLEKSIIQWKLDGNQQIVYEAEEEEHHEPADEPIEEDKDYEFQGQPQAEEKKTVKKDEDDEFAEDQNEGDQALAVKPFLGQVIASTPSQFVKPVVQQYNVLPSESLRLSYAWGIRNQYISDEVRNQLKYTEKGNSCVYFTAALGVELDLKDQSQKFYNQQTEDLISMSITPDRKIVATGQMAQVDKQNKKIPKVDIHIWQVEDKKQVKVLKGFHHRAIVILEFSPDGSQLLSIGQDDKNTLAVYNWSNSKIAWSAPTSKGKATGACWKNNKEYCTIGTDHIKFWTEAKGTMGKVPGKWQSMHSVAFLDGAKYVSGGLSGTLFFWNGGSATKIEAHKGKVHTIKVDKGKTVYSGAEDGKIICWKYNGNQLAKQAQIADFAKVSPLSPGILSIDIHPSQDRMLVCTKSSQIHEFPINKFESNKCHMKAHYAGELWCCCVSPDSARFVTGGDDKTIRVYDIQSHSQVKLAETTNIIRAVDWCKAAPNLIVAGDWKGLIYLYDADGGKNSTLLQLDIGKTRFSKMKPNKPATYWIQDIKFSPDGESVAFGAHGGRSHVEVFKIVDNKKFGASVVLNVGFSSALLSLDWNVDSSAIAAVSQAYEFKFVNPNASDPKFADMGARSMRDEKWASWSNKFGWMVQGIFQQVQYFSIHSVCRNPEETLLATGGTDQTVKLHKYPVIAPKQVYKQYFGHSSHITRVKFSENEDYLLSTGGNDRTTILWDVIRPNKSKKQIKKQEEEQEQQEQIVQKEDEEQENKQTQQSQVKQTFDDDIDIPANAVQKEDVQVNQEEQDQFGQDDNEGDQFMAVLPWKGALVAPTLSYKQTTGKPPKAKIFIQYAYGYRTKDCRNNLKYLENDIISYHTAGLGVVMNISDQPQQQTFFDKHNDDILSICWSEDKSSIFTGEQGPKCPIYEWKPTGQMVKKYSGMIKGVVALACNERYLAAAGMDDDHIVMVFDRKTGKLQATQKGGKQFIVALQFIDQKTFASVGIKHYKVWNIEKGKLTAKKGSFQNNNNLLTCAKLKDGKILAGAADGTLQVWKENSISNTVKNLHEGKPLEAICCLGNVIITGGKDRKINILDNKYKTILTIDCQKHLKGYSICPQIRSIDALGNKLLIGTISSEIFQLQCTQNINQITSSATFKQPKCKMSGHYAANAKWTNEVWGLAITPGEDKFVTCSDDSTVRVWDMETRKQLTYQRLDLGGKDNDKPIAKNKLTGDFQQKAKGRCVAISENGYVLVGCKQGTLRVFSPDLKQKAVIKVSDKQISDIKFSADNSLVGIGAHDSKIHMYKWDGKGKLTLACRMTGHHSTITHIDFSKDGNYLHSNSRDYQLLFWDTNTGKQLTSGATMLRDEYFNTWTSCIGWPVEGIWELCSKGTDINAIDRTKEVDPYEGKTLLCVADDFGQVRLLEYPVRNKNSQSVNGNGHSSHVTCVRFSNDDSRVISTGGEDQTIIQWRIER